jgi:4-hydroxy-tetrahydrodipicolinate synthase
MKKFLFQGTGVAMVTPFRKDGSINFNTLSNLVEHLIENNTNFLVVLGTTGESVTLTKNEKQAVSSHIIEQTNGRIPILLGIGGNNTIEIINSIKEQDYNGVDGLLSVVPYYNCPEQTGIFKHYKEIAMASPVPIVAYNVPGRTGVNMTAETCIKIAHEIKNIVAVKEASGNLKQAMHIINNKPDDFHIISGDDFLTFPLISLGASGTISVIGNAFPDLLSRMVSNALKGQISQARKIHFQLLDITEMIFSEGSPAGIKAALDCLGILHNHLRLPLTPVSRTLYNNISRYIKESKLK